MNNLIVHKKIESVVFIICLISIIHFCRELYFKNNYSEKIVGKESVSAHNMEIK